MLTHLESILGSRGALWGGHEVILGALRANMEAIIALRGGRTEIWGSPGRGRGGVNTSPKDEGWLEERG